MLHIWDDRGPGAAREPGLLSENSALRFAMYSPQPYTPLESAYMFTSCSHRILVLTDVTCCSFWHLLCLIRLDMPNM